MKKALLVFLMNFIFLASAVVKFGDITSCPPIAPHPPATNVNNLRFDDISVIGALGDSITAAFAADGLVGGALEYRGQSWAIGGDKGAITLANFFKNYQPNLQGQSYGSHIPEVCMPMFCPADQYQPILDQLNAAQSGAFVQNLQVQLAYWKQQLYANKKINVQKDWKLLTILIGANNLCRGCDPNFNIYDEAQDFEDQLQSLVSQLAEVPRLLVNFVSIFNISQVFEVSEKELFCRGVHDILGYLECECVFPFRGGDGLREKIDIIAGEYRSRTAKVVAAAPRRSDFAVVLQPMFSDMAIPGLNFLSQLDCFHPSIEAHQQMAISLWNTMQLPSSKKPLKVTFPQILVCPGNDTLLATN